MRFHLIAVCAIASALTACGGGGDHDEPKAQKFSAVKVVGASLEDTGTFGVKATVQPGSGGVTQRVWVEDLAAAYGLPAPCPYYRTSDGVTWTTQAGCTNYAIGGGRINYTSGSSAIDNAPWSTVKQLTDLGALGYAASDLLVVGESSGNDIAVLLEAYMSTAMSSTSDFQTLLGTLLPSSVISANASSPSALGTLYMQALADKLQGAVTTQALDKGARRVAIVNLLDATKTPRFNAVLAQVSATLGATAATDLRNLAVAWITAYNARLASNFAAYADKVVIVDFYAGYNDLLAHPSAYGLNNITSTVCDQLKGAANGYVPDLTTAGSTSFGEPAVIAGCTALAAATITPTEGADGTSTWWQHYMYSDNFHPTPYGHQLLSLLATQRLSQAGWQ